MMRPQLLLVSLLALACSAPRSTLVAAQPQLGPPLLAGPPGAAATPEETACLTKRYCCENQICSNNCCPVDACFPTLPDLNPPPIDIEGNPFIPTTYCENFFMYTCSSDYDSFACGDPHFLTWKGEKYDYHGTL